MRSKQKMRVFWIIIGMLVLIAINIATPYYALFHSVALYLSLRFFATTILCVILYYVYKKTRSIGNVAIWSWAIFLTNIILFVVLAATGIFPGVAQLLPEMSGIKGNVSGLILLRIWFFYLIISFFVSVIWLFSRIGNRTKKDNTEDGTNTSESGFH